MSRGFGKSRSDWYRIKEAEKGQATLLDKIERTVMDEKQRLHSLQGAAIEWQDGVKAHFIQGVFFDPYTWEGIVTGKITPKEAIHLTNVEQRRIAIQRIGFHKMLQSLTGKMIDMDFEHKYELYEIQLYDDLELREVFNARGWRLRTDKHYIPAHFVKVWDSTTNQPYFLRVPNHLSNCKAAVAWTFDTKAEEYVLEKQT